MSLSTRQYLAFEGSRCPNCESTHIMAEPFEEASQSVICRACGATWRDTYILTGFMDLEIENDEEDRGAGTA